VKLRLRRLWFRLSFRFLAGNAKALDDAMKKAGYSRAARRRVKFGRKEQAK
jgi:hypothetical protein